MRCRLFQLNVYKFQEKIANKSYFFVFIGKYISGTPLKNNHLTLNFPINYIVAVSQGKTSKVSCFII